MSQDRWEVSYINNKGEVGPVPAGVEVGKPINLGPEVVNKLNRHYEWVTLFSIDERNVIADLIKKTQQFEVSFDNMDTSLQVVKKEAELKNDLHGMVFSGARQYAADPNFRDGWVIRVVVSSTEYLQKTKEISKKANEALQNYQLRLADALEPGDDQPELSPHSIS